MIAVELKKRLLFVFGDVVLSSLYIAFLAPFIVLFRETFGKNILFKLLDEKKIQFIHISEINKIIGDHLIFKLGNKCSASLIQEVWIVI